jgi:hypothetical protein
MLGSREEILSEKYILEGKTPKIVTDLMTWATWFETADRTVAKDQIGDVRISTVFLGINHQWGNGPPLIFETMIFEGPHDGYQTRSSTWDEAEKQHAEAVALARSAFN